MPEYVYALHDFRPEYEDEVSFYAGELIVVIEKDEKYGDGWWRGRNLAGRVGLFPVSYTAPAPSTNTFHTLHSPEPISESRGISTSNRKSVLQPLTEESETDASGINILPPVPKHPTPLPNSDYDIELPHKGEASHNLASDDNEMMTATMTDVQKAIEQLGRDDVGEDGDGARSFSFASTRDGANTENSDTDFDLSDFDGTEINGVDGEDWREGARRKLVAKAKRAVEEAKKLEAMRGGNETGKRTIAPPIEVDFSDESEVEDDADDVTRSSDFHLNHPHTPEKDENIGTDGEATAAADSIRCSLSTDAFVPPKDEIDIPTATKASFSASPSPVSGEPLREEPEETPFIKKDIYPSPISPDLTKSSNVLRNHPHIPDEDENLGTDGETTAATDGIRYSVSTDVFVPPNDETDFSTATKPSFSDPQTPVPTESLPEKLEEKPPTPVKDIYPGPISPPTTTLSNIQHIPKRSITPVREISNGLPSPASFGHTKHNSIIISSSSTLGMFVNAIQAQQQQSNSASEPASISVSKTVQGRNESSLIEWSVKDVVDWLKSKGFDQNVCDRFIEQEISGDVLLELDVNLLKSEIGIVAFGKRKRIANAITDLRRPPSIEYSDHQLPFTQLHHSNSLTRSNSRTQSQSRSLPGMTPTSTVGHVHWNAFGGPGAGHDGQQSGHLQDSPVNINDDKAAGSVRVGLGNDTAADFTAGMSAVAGVGLGIALSPMNKPSEKRPPPRLLLSPINAALKESAAKTASAIAVGGEDDERGHMSDGEIVLNSTIKRPRTFVLSHKSSVSTMNLSSPSKSLPLSSPIVHDRDNDNVKGKETVTSDKGTGIRRTRSWRSEGSKPADQLTIFGATFGGTLDRRRKPPPSEDSETLIERASKYILPKLHISSIHRSLSTAYHRPPTPQATLQNSLLNSNHNVTTGIINANAPKSFYGASGFIKQANIIDRIGEPDHTGWMRKRRDNYNSWKRRYFILKGQHLYFLKSDNKSESRIKGYILIVGYKVTVDENVDPGQYGFRIDHDHDQTHYFSSKERSVVRDWMKAIMKATISRDYESVVSSCYIPTIPLAVAQAMNPTPRPPSPSAREAIQKASLRANTEQPSKRDTLILGLNVTDVKDGLARLNSFSSNAATVKGESNPSSPKGFAPPRPSRLGRMNSVRSVTSQTDTDDSLIKWANTHLPESLQMDDSTGFLSTGLGLGLLRLAESIKGQPCSPPVPNFAFPADIHDENLDGLFRLFDFLLNNDVKMGSVSINDVRLGRRDKIIQLLKALKGWEDKMKAHALSITLKDTKPVAFMLM